MKLNRLGILFGVIALLGQASSAEALIASVKSLGMAAAVTANPQDTLSAAYNPAGLVEVGTRLDTGINWAHFHGRTRISGNLTPPLLGINGTFKAYKTADFYSPEFGISKNFGCDCQYSAGFILYNRNQAKTTYRKNFPLLGTSHLGLEYVHEQMGPVFAWKVNDILNVGLSVNINVQRAKVRGIENFDNPFLSKNPGHVTNRGYSYSVGYGVTAGAQWLVTPCLRMGVAYTPECKMRRFHKYSGFLAQGGKFNLPQIFIAGISWRYLPCASISFDVEYDNWRKIKALSNRLTRADGTIGKLGAGDGPGFGWHSRIFYRLGTDWNLMDHLCVPLTVRAGYRYAPTQIRRSQTVVNALTMEPLVEHFLTFGGTYAVNECLEVSSFFGYGFNKKLSGQGSIPPNFRSGEATLFQRLYVLGVGCGWNW